MFKKKKPKYQQINSVKAIKAHLREFILDSQIPDGDDISRALGCSPISDELLEKEEEQSDLRVDQISFLVPLLYGYAALFSEAFIASMPKPKKMLPIADQMHNHPSHQSAAIMSNHLEEVMAHLLIGSVSQMVDLGLVELPKGKK